MGNVNAREEGNAGVSGEDRSAGSGAGSGALPDYLDHQVRLVVSRSPDFMNPAPPEIKSAPPNFAPQVPAVSLERPLGVLHTSDQMLMDEPGKSDVSSEKGIPIIITWSYGGNEVLVEGSWDNWRTRKALLRAGRDYSILLVLPSGVYQYRFIVDGEWRYADDFPHLSDEKGLVNNLLDVHDYVPENTQSVAEFEPPPSPESSYSQEFPIEEDFAKEPPAVPPQLHLTVFGTENTETSKAQHVVLNHLFIEKGWASQSLVALGLTHRFQSKYVTVVLYKALRK